MRPFVALSAAIAGFAIPPHLLAQEQPRAATTEAFGCILYVGVTSNILFEWDPDTGGYPDTFATMERLARERPTPPVVRAPVQGDLEESLGV